MTDFTRLPIVVTDQNRTGCLRLVQIAIGVPLAAFGIYGLLISDGSAFWVLLLGAAVLVGAELVRRWYGRNVPPERYEITTEGVRYSGIAGAWFEPLSAYTGVVWRQRTASRFSEGRSAAWRAELRHGVDRARSVVLLKSTGLSPDRDADRAVWQAMARTLGLPGEEENVPEGRGWDDA